MYAQEMWSSYHQFHQHKDDLSRMSAYDLECLQLEMGADTLRELQEEFLLKPAGTSFYERFLGNLATMGVCLSPLYNGEEGEPAPPLTVAAATCTP